MEIKDLTEKDIRILRKTKITEYVSLANHTILVRVYKKTNGCEGCYFKPSCSKEQIAICIPEVRKDGKDVLFKEMTETNPNVFTKEQFENLYKTMTTKKLAEMLGCSSPTVVNAAKRYGITLKEKGRPREKKIIVVEG